MKGTRAYILFGAVLLIAAAVTVIVILTRKPADDKLSSDPSPKSSDSSVSDTSSQNDSQEPFSGGPEPVQRGNFTLDAAYSRLLFVNGKHPLPEGYDYEGNLTTIDAKYINGSLKQFDKDVYPYLQAMIEAAWADGVKLYVWSPYRSYSTQEMLYQNQVQRCRDRGLDEVSAQAEAATVVAKPGTSEHHTGLALDFNMASDKFEQTDMYTWLKENAADYGFIMRYSAEKQPLTGVIHESWHWRFVGINVAKEINEKQVCLEEYLKN